MLDGAGLLVPLLDMNEAVWCSKLPTVGDGDFGLGFAALAAVRLHGGHHIHAIHHLSKHHVLPVEPTGTHTHTGVTHSHYRLHTSGGRC